MVKGETSSIETYIGSAIGGAIGGVLGTPAAIGKIGTTLGLPGKVMRILQNPAFIGATSSGISTAIRDGLEAITGTQERTAGKIIGDISTDILLGGGLGFIGSKIKIQGINAGRNSYEAIFFSGIRKLVNNTGRMHLKTVLKGFFSKVIEAIRDEFSKTYINEKIEQLKGCVEGD